MTASNRVREVWAWNFRSEFFAFLETLRIAGAGAFVALDSEFPGWIQEGHQGLSREQQYEALRCNVGLLRPIQLGFAVAKRDGSILGAWTFNLRFNVASDLHTEASLTFLAAAGIDFGRLALEGIDQEAFGQILASSPVIGPDAAMMPCWVTFSGLYDLGYLLKLICIGAPLPRKVEEYDQVLAARLPNRRDVREVLPFGSLESLRQERGLVRSGTAHTAGSDALVTLQLFLLEEELMAFSPPGFERQSFAPPPGLDPPMPRTRPSSSWAAAAGWSAFSPVLPRPLRGERRRSQQGDGDAAAGVPRSGAAPPELWAAAAREDALQLSLSRLGVSTAFPQLRPVRAA